MAGGTAGGWALVVTYENPNEDRRFLSSFDGYAFVENGGSPITYSYSGFQTIPNGPVKATFGIAALEGDEGYEGDQLAISTLLNPVETTLSNAVSPESNFFNSSISKNGINVTSRNPKSRNTLGFDIDQFAIPNSSNKVISNNETEVTFSVTTSQDQFATFLNIFAVEAIEPDLKIQIEVLNKDSNSVSEGSAFNLGEEISYKLTVQNLGNDDAINTTIRNVISINTDFLPNTVEKPNGVEFTYDEFTGTIDFTIPDNLITEQGSFTLQFKVRIADTCQELRNACSNILSNSVKASYTGRQSGITVEMDSSSTDANQCQVTGVTSINFISNLGACEYEFETVLCDNSALLTAGNGFGKYIWRNAAGTIVGSTQTITVTTPGSYTVITSNSGCTGTVERHTVIALTTADQNPALIVADDIKLCTINNSALPILYLCGEDGSRLIDASSFVNASSIQWEKLDEGSCADPLVGCANMNTSCNWTTVGTNSTFTVNDPDQGYNPAGQYRISLIYNNTCTENFYFTVFQNRIDPILISNDIVCNEPGFIRIDNVPNGAYEFSLNNEPFQKSNVFVVTEPGEYLITINSVSGTGFCSFKETVTVLEENKNCPVLSNESLDFSREIVLYPNPTSGPIAFSGTITKATLYDPNGKIIFETTRSNFDISPLPKGIYFIKVNIKGKVSYQRLVKQ